MKTEDSKIIASGILRAILYILGGFLLLYFLWKIQAVLAYISMAAVFSLIARPFLLLLVQKLKIPNTIAVIITILIFIALVAGLIGLFIPLILSQGENLSLLNTNAFRGKFEIIMDKATQYLAGKNINILEELKNFDILGYFKTIPNLLNSFISSVGSLSVGVFSTLFITFFLLKDKKILTNALFAIVPTNIETKLQISLDKIKDLLSRYFIGLIFQIGILFLIYTSTLLIFGVDNAVVIAFLCAILNLIPYVGPLVGGILMLMLSITSNLNLNFQNEVIPATTYIMTGYLIAQLIDNLISQPLIFSKSVHSHPLEVFLVIIIWGILFGPLGMVVAIPTYTALKVILKEFLVENKIVSFLTKGL